MIKQIKKMSYLVVMIGLIAGCTTTTPPIWLSGTQIVTEPHIIQVPTTPTNDQFLYGDNPLLQRAFNRYVQTGVAPNIITNGFMQMAYNAGQQPIIATTPLQETVISLEPGEKFTNISSGDPNRWSYAVAISGVGANQQQHVLVKPALFDISTNLVITTDRRWYNLRLVSLSHGNITRQVSFWYPAEWVNTANQATLQSTDTPVIASSPVVNLNQLNFAYRMNCGGFFHPCPVWRPVRIFDDGIHTYIQFPLSMQNQDMPALFVLTGNQQDIVNYRSKAPYIVVDKIFKQAVLIMGVGQQQTKVTIINKGYL
jgi:type IV secretion system protein VirB9